MEVGFNYYDFAAQDAKYFLEDVENGRVANYLASMAQNICERYLKHIINEFHEPESEMDEHEKIAILRTHSIKKLTDFIVSKMEISMDDDKRDNIERADGYYFTSRYPGEDSFFVTRRDINKCKESVIDCQEFVNNLILEHQKEQEKSYLFEEILAGEHTVKFTSSEHLNSELEIE